MNGGWNLWSLFLSEAHVFSSSNSWKTLSEISFHLSSFLLSICIQSPPTNQYRPQRISHSSRLRWSFASASNPLFSKKKKKNFIKKDRILSWSQPEDEKNAERHIVVGRTQSVQWKQGQNQDVSQDQVELWRWEAWLPQCGMECVNMQSTWQEDFWVHWHTRD